MHKVLVVDDDDDIRFITGYILQKNGFEVETACDGVEAFEKVISFDPEVIILDIFLGRDDGRVLCPQLKSIAHNEVRIILYSAQMVHALNPSDFCADAYLSKPYDIYNLVRAVHQLTV